MTLKKTVLELNGDSVIDIEGNNADRKQILSSQSFGERQTELSVIKQALANHVTRATEKLRQQNSVCSSVNVFLQTSLYFEEKYRNAHFVALPHPTQDTRIILKAANTLLVQIFHTGFLYSKVGVMLCNLEPADKMQLDIFSACDDAASEKMMALVDNINQTMGRDSIQLAARVFDSSWKMKQERLSNISINDWNNLPTVES